MPIGRRGAHTLIRARALFTAVSVWTCFMTATFASCWLGALGLEPKRGMIVAEGGWKEGRSVFVEEVYI